MGFQGTPAPWLRQSNERPPRNATSARLTVVGPFLLHPVPGALDQHGRPEVLQPAVQYAEEGFPISEEIASGWRMKNALPLTRCCSEEWWSKDSATSGR